jgi:diguanylate cyclase (GGDEF)-like protein
VTFESSGTDVQPTVARALADTAEIQASRERVRSELMGRERAVTLALATGFVVAAAACALFVPSSTSFEPWVALLLVAVYAVVAQIEFEVGPASAVPTQLVLVPMLFAVPPGYVPLLVGAGLALAGLLERARSHRHEERIAVLLCSSWHSIAPAVVIGAFAPGLPSAADLPVYLLAFCSQVALDSAAVLTRHTLGRGARLSALVRPLAWAALVDASLAPAALVIATVAVDEPLVVLCVLPVAGLLHELGSARRRRIDHSIVLGHEVRSARRAARSDPLTGVGNRLAWQEALASAQERLAERGTGGSVLLVDLNRLKETNDTYGHDAGDRHIQALAVALRDAVPDATELARIGGDEFAILADDADEAACEEIVARVHRAVTSLDVGGIAVSASLGSASCPPSRSFDEAVREADARLYAAKAATARDP